MLPTLPPAVDGDASKIHAHGRGRGRIVIFVVAVCAALALAVLVLRGVYERAVSPSHVRPISFTHLHRARALLAPASDPVDVGPVAPALRGANTAAKVDGVARGRGSSAGASGEADTADWPFVERVTKR